MRILFLIDGFHFNHLYKGACNRDVTLCIITKFMNKWMFTFCEYNCSLSTVFTLCKAFIIFYWTYANI
jgi:hypothetical protein